MIGDKAGANWVTTKILLIEPDAAHRKVIADFLREKAFAVTEGSSGTDGAMELHQQRFDLLIYDFDIDKADKLKLAFTVRITRQTPSVIVLTPSPRITADTGLFKGPLEFVEKPVDLRQLDYLLTCMTSTLCRRGIGLQTWHICSNCSDWPQSNYEELTVNLHQGLELCNECRVKLQTSHCH